MKVKLIALALIAAIFGIIGIASTSSSKAESGSGGTAMPASSAKPVQQDLEGIIDGAKNPEKISDRIAYTLLFRFLSGRNTEAEKNRARSYLRQALGCRDCGTGTTHAKRDFASDAEVGALLSIASEFEQRVSPLDHQAKDIKDDNKPQLTPNDRAKLKNLQRQKEAVVDALITSLPNRLGSNGAGKLQRYINEEMKPKVKIKPSLDSSQAAPTSNSVT